MEGDAGMERKAVLEAWYAGYDEEARLASRHGQVEFLTTMRYIERYLQPGMRVLEIGAGTGRYSRAIAAQGYRVDAIELVQSNVERFQSLTAAGMDVHVRQGDALEMDNVPAEGYDLVLLLGPMYHLFTPEEQRRAYANALRATRSGGILMTAFCIADASILMYGFVRGNIFQLLESGMLDPEGFIARSDPKDLFQLWRKEDIDALTGQFAVQRLHYVATDLAANYQREAMDAMDERAFAMYMRWHFTLCERPDMVGATHHALDISRRLA